MLQMLDHYRHCRGRFVYGSIRITHLHVLYLPKLGLAKNTTCTQCTLMTRRLPLHTYMYLYSTYVGILYTRLACVNQR